MQHAAINAEIDANAAPTPSSLEQIREQAINDIAAVFADSDPARALRHVAHAAFMRGAWAGLQFDSRTIMELADRDRVAVMAAVEAARLAGRQP